MIAKEETVGKCRNCGSKATKELGSIGVVAPFVLKRVFSLEMGYAPSRHPVRRFLRPIDALAKIARKIYGTSPLMEIECCTECSFLQTKIPLAEDALARLYVDYRSESYNLERTHYEPAYALIASQVGSGRQEIEVRLEGLTTWLKSRIEIDGSFSMLDYGGADGKFLPDLPGEKYVYEISDIEPIPGIERVRDEAALKAYSYIQVAHVLEHVPYPLALTLKASSYLREGGYFYVEVPQDLSDETISQIAQGDQGIPVPLHEHINYYTVASAARLMVSAGLTLIDVEAVDVDLGWTRAKIIRALGKKC